MLGQFIDATGSQKFKKLDHMTCTDRAVSFQIFPFSTKMISYVVTLALSLFLYKQIRTTFLKKNHSSHMGQKAQQKVPLHVTNFMVKMASMTKIQSYSNDLQYIN